MKFRPRILLNIILPCLLLALGATACSDDFPEQNPVCPEGEWATLRLNFQVADVAVNSRASDAGVETLWIGIYNVSSGACTFNKVYQENADNPEHVLTTIDGIDCRSGKSYVVGVANIDGQTATDLTTGRTAALRDLLLQADTWEKYRAIAMAEETSDGGKYIHVDAVASPLLMSGGYMTSHREGSAADVHETLDIRPGANNPDGAIHLRRIWAQNTIKISAGGNIVDMDVTNIQVYNVPLYSWLDSRDGQDETTVTGLCANAGDYVNPQANGVNAPEYLPSLRFTPPAEIIEKDGVYTFSWWQYENKRTGTSTDYQQREIRHKPDGENTDVFKSLSESPEGSLANNATYVRINATVTYLDPQNNLQNPDGLDLPSSSASRTASVTYFVHLGYMNNDATDFNCHRNSRNTYNITVKSVNEILVEAFSDIENQPGAQGTVTDVTDKIEMLDAHNGVFNIYLSANEIKNFTFSMRTYASGQLYNIQDQGEGVNNIPAEGSPEFKYYNWIELVPTGYTSTSSTYETRFAAYPDLTGSNSRAGRVYYPGELSSSGLKGQWFTVYVNEYAYESRYGEDGYGVETGTNWKGYVNQPARSAWFNVAQETSSDGMSVYYRAKYALTQKSIQTYYNVADNDCKTALGLEHDNESFGQNIRWTVGAETAPDNGRFNSWDAVQKSPSWSNYVTLTSQQQVKALTNTVQTKAAGIDVSAKNYALPAQVLLSSSKLTGSTGGYLGKAGSQDPQTSATAAQYIEAIYACLNRNRDENGNGVIDLPEMKWYLPASGKYLRMILGRNSLQTPLMNFQQATLPDGCGNDANTLYHYISSDAKIIWVDEGMSSSQYINSNVTWAHAPWQLRCIRNLGTDLTKTPTINEVEQVEPAYVSDLSDSDTGGGMVHVRRYYGTALREPTTTPLPMHKASSSYNKLGRYGFEIAPAGNTFSGSYEYEASSQFIDTEKYTVTAVSGVSYDDYSSANTAARHCASLNNTSARKGWRLPNQKEIVIMLRLGVLRAKSDYHSYKYYTLSTEQVSTTCFMTCTQEHWANNGTNPGNSAEALSWNYRLTTVERPGMIAVAATGDRITSVRCVRDLTSSEQNKSYSELIE